MPARFTGTIRDMVQQLPKESKPMRDLRKIALQYPETDAGASCNKVAYKARGKSFLFVGADGDAWNAMFKLGDSIDELRKLAKKAPDRYNVGKTNWVTLVFPHKEAPSVADLERWIDESFRLIAPKKLVAELDAT